MPAGARPVTRLRAGDRVVVIGAGPAGLTAAYLLARQGFDVTVLEGSDDVGGISRTALYKGYRFDIGGHRFLTKITPVQEFWDELLGRELIDVSRLSRIHYEGTYFDYPLTPMNALSGLGVMNAIMIVLSYLKAHFRPSLPEVTFEQWVTNRFGRRLYELFFKGYTEKVWGIPCTEIRAEWAAQRIKGLSLYRAIRSATPLIGRWHGGIKSLTESFKYPRLGPGQMWDACANRVRAFGGTVLLRHHVSGIAVENGAVKSVVVQTDTGEQHFDADHVISSTDIRSLVRALGDAMPGEARTAAEGLAYRDFLVVALILKRKDVFPDNWIYIHTPGVQVGRIQNFKNWSAAMVPEPDHTCLGMEYFCFEGDNLWATSDSDLVALATRELEKLGMACVAEVIDGTVVRMPKAYPIYDAAYSAHVNTVRSSISVIPNLHTVGRNGMHKYNNADHSMYTAMLTVENMRGATHDIWAVNTDFEYLEEQRVTPSAPRAFRQSSVDTPGEAVRAI